MFDLESTLESWRRVVSAKGSLTEGDVDELEDHLLTSFESLIRRGESAEDAWEAATAGLGSPAALQAEYRKVHRRGWRWLLAGAWALFAVSWELPTIRVMGTSFSGFMAFLFAGQAGAVWAASVATNLLMILTLWRPSRLRGHRLTLLAAAMVAAVILNGAWFAMGVIDGDIGDLLPGYYAWWGSFGLAAAALVRRARRLGSRIALFQLS